MASEPGKPDTSDGDATTIRAPSTDPHDASRLGDAESLVEGQHIGRYRLVSRLGAGAMGVVWSAFDPQLDRRVAIKVVHPTLARAPDASTRLLREARAMAKLSHRAVVTVHDAGEIDGRLFLAMELVRGTTLGAMLRARDAAALADWPRWLALVQEAGRGLAAAHRQGVLHRDFKPDNVLVDERVRGARLGEETTSEGDGNGRVCVGDFGLATLGVESRAELSQRWSSTDLGSLDLTVTGALLGTPGYMSPQQLRGGAVDARADQFSFCVTAWEAVYGARPFHVQATGLDAIAGLLDAIEAGAIEPPPAATTVPDAVCAILRRGLAAQPEARWPDMDALLAALDDAAGTRTASVPPTGPSSVPPAPAATTSEASATAATTARSSMRLYATMGALAIAIGAIVVVVTLVLGARRERARQHRAGKQATAAVIAKPLFGVAVRTTLGISPDGSRIALGGESIEVRSLDDPKQLWSTRPPGQVDIVHIELDDRAVRFGTKLGRSVYRWRYLESDAVEVERDVGGRWFGRTTRGDLVYSHGATPDNAWSRMLRVVESGKEVWKRDVKNHVEVCAVSPDRSRVAFVDADRFTGRIHVWNLIDDSMLQSRQLTAPTAIAWVDDKTLVFATGTQQRPTIHRVAIEQAGLSRETPIYSLETGWFGQLVVHGRKLYVTQMKVQSRARVLERTGAAHDFDPSTVAAAFAWESEAEFLAWNRSSGRVQRRTRTDHGVATALRLDGEPANATRVDGNVIVTLRRPEGREAIALARDNTVLWRHGDLQTLAVRCAGDRQAPCFAVRSGSRDSIHAIDWRTGTLGDRAIYEGLVEDIAVRDDGQRILVARSHPNIVELDANGTLVTEHALPHPSTRSIAYDPHGGFLVGATRVRSKYEVGRFFENAYTTLTETDNDLLSLVRPSLDGSQILVLLRVYSPEIYELTLPDR